MSNSEDQLYVRPDVPYVSKCSGFTFKEERLDFARQFNNFYQSRFDVLRPRIIDAATRKWGSHVPVRKLTDLHESKDECVILGTIYKIQALKPSVLKEIADDASVITQPIRAFKFTSADDKCLLEDENLRVKLSGAKMDHGLLVTGITVGVYGWQAEGGTFEVLDICFALPPQPAPPSSLPSTPEDGDCYVLVLSGLNFRGEKAGDAEDARREFYCRLLADWITGRIGETEELAKISRIVRVIVAGGSISKKCQCDGREYGQIARFRARKTVLPSDEAVRMMDKFLINILSSVDVDLMPGEHDPTNHMFPQQPWHRCLLPKSTEMTSLHQCTNPYAAEIAGVNFLGTSGQNVHDILKFSTIDDSVTALAASLKWCHICPTAPDTLDCYPYYDTDPFIIEGEMPHIYFAGNQADLQVKILDHRKDSSENGDENGDGINGKTLLLSLPKFSETGVCALVNLRTLEVEPIVFYTDHISQNGSSDFSLDMDNANGQPGKHGKGKSTGIIPGTPDLFA